MKVFFLFCFFGVKYTYGGVLLLQNGLKWSKIEENKIGGGLYVCRQGLQLNRQ